MKTTKILTILVLASAIMVWTAEVSEAAEMGTAFTYQGRLIDKGRPADGLYDFQFKLYDSNDPCTGSQLGSPLDMNEVDVLDGHFTVELDFGSGIFDGNAVWLATRVVQSPIGSDPCTLSPLLELTPTPYALHTRWFLVDEALDNVFAGEGAGASNTTGYGNTFSGYQAGRNNTTGKYNTFSGYQAGYTNTAGFWNTFLGYQAGYNTTGDRNTFSGYQAGYSNTTGYYNTAIGNYALFANTEGASNSAMGDEALWANTTGNRNSAMGHGTLSDNTTGNNNSAMGYGTLSDNTTGNYNTAMGSYANRYNQEGSRNTTIGYEAGRGTGVHNKSGNVFLGYRAGYSETGDNKLYIANDSADANVLIYGDFSTGNVGIGTTSPQDKLEVSQGMMTLDTGPGGSITGIRIRENDDMRWTFLYKTWDVNDKLYIRDEVGGRDVMTFEPTTGNVGIGTTSPLSKLSVGGDGYAGTGVYGSGSGVGVRGEHDTSGDYGYLGSAGAGVYGESSGGNGVYGQSSSSYGVYGYSISGQGVYGTSSGNKGYLGLAGGGVEGRSTSGFGVYGWSTSGQGVKGYSFTGKAGDFQGDVYVTGDLSANGSKSFVQPHAKDPSREIVYIAAEAPEAVVLHRGTSHLKEGVAVIELPEHFGLVAAEEGIQVQVTPRSADTFGLAVMQRSREKIVVKELKNGRSNFEFDYFVTAVRAGFEGHKPVVANTHFKPEADETAEDFEARYTKDNMSTKAIRSMLISNGILTEEGKLNMVKVSALGWTVAEKDKSAEERLCETRVVARKAGEL